ncbi:MAG: T9SS type A sorting domain-containing protein [Schleiferiaceae bacterium]|nr:T9SS type A sorting domain-containing protein [Schleiferiaceae bacterium]
MEKSDSKRLSQYVATAAALLGGTAAQAQYQYTDIPDTTIVDGVFELDLDGDTIVDFTIEHILGGGQLGNVNAVLLHPGDSIEGNLAMGAGQNGFSYVEKVLPGTSIDAAQVWSGINATTEAGYMAFHVDGVAYPNSNWAGPMTDGYLGLRIVKEDTACYGWARIDIADSAKSFTIKDWSFNPAKDSLHTAGFELLDVMETVLRDLNIAQIEGYLDVTLGSPQNVSVLDATGKVLAASSKISGAHRFNTELWSTGMYIVRIEGDSWHHNLKVWIP